MALRITTPEKKSVRKLQREIDQIKRACARDVERPTQKGASQDEIQGILQDASFETDMAQEQIQIILSAPLFHDANRLGIPGPRYTDPDSDQWEQGHNGQIYLSLKGQSELRSRIRQEEKERREATAFWVKDILVPVLSVLLGIIGATTGLVAILRK
jgi:hypothetical protein